MRNDIIIWVLVTLVFIVLFLGQNQIVNKLNNIEKTVNDTNAVISLVFKPAR